MVGQARNSSFVRMGSSGPAFMDALCKWHRPPRPFDEKPTHRFHGKPQIEIALGGELSWLRLDAEISTSVRETESTKAESNSCFEELEKCLIQAHCSLPIFAISFIFNSQLPVLRTTYWKSATFKLLLDFHFLILGTVFCS